MSMYLYKSALVMEGLLFTSFEKVLHKNTRLATLSKMSSV